MQRKYFLGAAVTLLLLAAACSSYNQESSSPPPASASPAQTTSAQASAQPDSCASTPAALPSVIAGVPTVPAGVQQVATPSGLRYVDIAAGNGDTAKAGQTATVNYTGWLPDGKKFDSSVDRGQPFSFPLGGGQVIKGWDEGVSNMHVGGERLLIVPPSLGYGSKGAGGVIPPCATLIFDVKLLGVK
jgi:FKBP-type peptidyl-prolyl cis-trans isomerase